MLTSVLCARLLFGFFSCTFYVSKLAKEAKARITKQKTSKGDIKKNKKGGAGKSIPNRENKPLRIVPPVWRDKVIACQTCGKYMLEKRVQVCELYSKSMCDTVVCLDCVYYDKIKFIVPKTTIKWIKLKSQK